MLFIFAALLSVNATAQSSKPQKPKIEKALAGAGTTNEETNGLSPPSPGSSSEPNKPQAKFCNDYKGAVRTACLQTVLNQGKTKK